MTKSEDRWARLAMSSRQLGGELGETAKMAFTRGRGSFLREFVLVCVLCSGVEMD